MIKKRRFKLGKNEKEILRLATTGALFGASLVAPNLSLAFQGKSKKSFRQSLRRAYDKNLIFLSGEEVCLSKTGQELLNKIEKEEITLEKKDEWDGIWRIVAYDIPEEEKKERDYFRKKLKSWGFKELQKSMFVIPYECKEEVAVVAQNIGISPYVMYLITDNLPRQKEFIKTFGLDDFS